MSEENTAEEIKILRETYELGSRDFQSYVCWFPAIVGKFGDQLEDIANQIARGVYRDRKFRPLASCLRLSG